MLGSALKLGLNTNTLGKNSTDIFFPRGRWCDVYNRKKGLESCMLIDKGHKVSLETKAYDFYVHLREGYIIPW